MNKFKVELEIVADTDDPENIVRILREYMAGNSMYQADELEVYIRQVIINTVGISPE